MSRFYGYQPESSVKSAVESFESGVQLHTTGGTLLGTVYVDIRDDQWAVAMAYGTAQHPKIQDPEPQYEIRYVYSPEKKTETLRIDTRGETHRVVVSTPYPDVRAFVLAALDGEKTRISGKTD